MTLLEELKLVHHFPKGKEYLITTKDITLIKGVLIGYEPTDKEGYYLLTFAVLDNCTCQNCELRRMVYGERTDMGLRNVQPLTVTLNE